MPTSAPRTQRDAIAAARDLYDRLYRDLRADVPDTEWAALEAAFQKGEATLATLDSTATDLPLSGDNRELLAGYLEGPADDDLEGRHAWLTLLPELLVDIRRAEEAEHASLIQPAYGSRGLVWEDLAAVFASIREVQAVLGEMTWPSVELTTSAVLRATDDWKFLAEESARYVVTSWTEVVTAPTTRAERPSTRSPEGDGEPSAKRNRQFAIAA